MIRHMVNSTRHGSLAPLSALVVLLLVAALVATSLPEGTVKAAPAPLSALPIVEPARHPSYSQNLPGSKHALDMVALPGGTYVLGSASIWKGSCGQSRSIRI
jgi:hypothetical protein